MSNIQLIRLGEFGALLDELETCFRFVAHELLDHFAGGDAVILDDLDAEQRAERLRSIGRLL